MHSRVRAAVAAVATLGIFAVTGSATAATPADSSQLRSAVGVAGIMQHQQAFQNIASANMGTRASGTPGYDASLAYVKSRLDATGYYTTRVQQFDFAFFSESAPAQFQRTSPDPETYALNDDFLTMEYSGAGDVTAALQEVNDNQFPPGPTASSSSAGCEMEDFGGFTAGNVALIQRGTCDFAVKANNAEEAGASAVIIFNEGQEGRQEALNGTLGGPDFAVPVIGTSFAVGQELHDLLESGPVSVRVATFTTSETRRTANLLADTKTGRSDRTVVVGSHLDSVPEGEGINDNGSGSASDLEVAIQMARTGVKPRNKVRFAWWGAEESGLIGSQFYVDSLTARERKDIAVNLNFDMVGSPNFVRFVYDGDASDTDSLASTGSGVVEDVFVDYFDSQDLASEPTAFDGRSDYDAFISAGIPAGGLFSGAEEIKTPEQAAVYGGTAGVAYDPCYHQDCDDIDNQSSTALDQMSDAIAHGTLTFAQTTSAVEGTDKGKGSGGSEAEYQGAHLRK